LHCFFLIFEDFTGFFRESELDDGGAEQKELGPTKKTVLDLFLADFTLLSSSITGSMSWLLKNKSKHA